MLFRSVAIVTGGGRGIGRGISRRFAREGATVVVAEIDEKDGQAVANDLAGLGGTGLFVRTDVMDRENIESTVATTVGEFGRVDILVNDAISLAPHTPFQDKTDSMFQYVLQVGLWATFWGMRAVFPHMRDQGGGRIINFYSSDGDFGQWYHVEYNAAKAGIRGLTVSGAAEWGQYNILCNAIAPSAAGTVYYEILAKNPALAEAARLRPLGRIGDPEDDIAPVALFLATEDSQFVNGQTLYVDGGGRLGRAGVYPPDTQDKVDAWLARHPD